MDADDLLTALDPEQREVAMATRGPVCVLAGAGTGKTRAITHRIAYAVATGIVNPAHVLALTFTVRAAGELRGRLRLLGGGAEAVRASTFHSAALRQLTYFWPKAIGGRAPRLIESKHALIREAARDLRLARTEVSALAEAVTEIEWAKVCQTHPDAYVPAAMSAGRTPALGVETVGRLYQAYEQMRRDRQLIDFESVLELTSAILLTEPVFAREVHSAFRYFTVDEFQDVNPLQKLLLDAWLGGRSDVCVVGDPQQTIYSFTGATSAYLRSFGSDYPDARVVQLVRDYRSTPQVVAVANRLIALRDPADPGPADRAARADRTARADGARAGGGAGTAAGASVSFGGAVPGSAAMVPAGAGPALELVAQRPGGPPPTLTKYPDEEAEATGVASSVRSLLDRGVTADEIAILLRINAHSERFERALDAVGVPYVIRGGERFYDRPEVRKALVLLRGAARAAEDGADASGLPGALPAAVRHVLLGAGLTAHAPETRGAARDRWESLAAIAALADDMSAARPEPSLGEFAAELAQRSETGHAPAANAVTLATMHAAKGLEWDAVLVPGLVEGIIPIVHARTTEAIGEERRLLYVAVTRAREHLMLSWAPSRAPADGSRGGDNPRGTRGGQERQRSRFLDGLLQSAVAVAVEAGR
ncbi:MAG TPA: ATP-dependent helicase [Trebonia sp.]|nr:ATP-dependent helicase [Trebonia sp.]